MRITAKAADTATATSIVDDEADRLRTLLGPLVFGTDHDNMESAVLAMLEARGHTLGVAESLTGGLLGSRLASVPGASAVFRGGIVAYHPEVKQQLLDVPVGPVVTETVALAMARGRALAWVPRWAWRPPAWQDLARWRATRPAPCAWQRCGRAARRRSR